MNIGSVRKVLFALLLVPAFYFFYIIITNQGVLSSNILVIIFSSGLPILGLYLRKKWFFYYIYFGVGFILFSLIFFIGLFMGNEGWKGVVTIAYFLIIILFTKRLHQDYKKSQI